MLKVQSEFSQGTNKAQKNCMWLGSMSNYLISILYLEITPFFIRRKKNVRGDGSFVR